MKISRKSVKYVRNNCRYADDILRSEEFKGVKSYIRHLGSTDTCAHSIRVAVGAGKLASLMGADKESAIKVGLVHDMCYVDYLHKSDHSGLYAFYHPVEAVGNGARVVELSKEERDAIISHMFPLGIHVPMSRIALALTLSDKAVATYESICGIKEYVIKRSQLKNNKK